MMNYMYLCISLIILYLARSSSARADVAGEPMPFDTVNIHLLEKDSNALINLYQLREGTDGDEYPQTFTEQLNYDGKDAQKQDRYIDKHLIYTKFTLLANSTLWYYWSGYELNARRFRLKKYAPPILGSITCLADLLSCAFIANVVVHNEDTDNVAKNGIKVGLFATGTATLLPDNLFPLEGLTEKIELYIPANKQTITVYGPFKAGVEDNIIILAEDIRHRYNFVVSPRNFKLGKGRVLITPTDAYQVTELSRIGLTLVVVYASLVVVYMWALPKCVTFSVCGKIMISPFLWLPFLYHNNNVLRSFQLVVLLTIGLLDIFHVKQILSIKRLTIYMALETLYSATMLLHESTTNMTSSVVSGAILVSTLTYYNNDCWPLVHFVLLVLATITFFNDNAEPYIHLEYAARYGIESLYLSIFLTALLFEIGLHLRCL